MLNKFDFKNLFVFEMANNHQGDVNHGKKIIQAMGKIAKENNIKASVKLQFRQLDSFIHPDFKEGTDNKHIPRFLSTRLSKKDFKALVDEIRKEGLIPMCTPFDEESVDVIEEMDIDIIKVGSCSAKDWPLLERIAEAGKPVIFSTGGLETKDIDNLVSFFNHRGNDYALMHCVSIYPIPENKFHLNQIDMLRERYPDVVIGWSTHEAPEETDAVQIAVAKGAGMFERHVGVETDKIKLNKYSGTPEQTDKWVKAYRKALTLCGEYERPNASEVEVSSLDSLSRGVYLKKDVKPGLPLERGQVFFAMPIQEGQVSSGRWKDLIIPKKGLKAGQPLKWDQIDYPAEGSHMVIREAVHEVKALLNKARVYLSSEFKVEYSHHYGMENFFKTGCVLIECINREYCKKIVVQLPGQAHPSHFHRRKEETFQVLWGTLNVEIDGHHRILHQGDTLLVLPGVWHNFWTDTGCVAEEVSTTHFNNDSVYRDKQINRLAREERKTIVDHWGRFQLPTAQKATAAR